MRENETRLVTEQGPMSGLTEKASLPDPREDTTVPDMAALFGQFCRGCREGRNVPHAADCPEFEPEDGVFGDPMIHHLLTNGRPSRPAKPTTTPTEERA